MFDFNEVNEGLRMDAGVHENVVLKGIEVISDDKGDKIAFEFEGPSGTFRHMEFAPTPEGNNFPRKNDKTGMMESNEEAYARVAKETYTRLLHIINRFVDDFKVVSSDWIGVFNELLEAWEGSELQEAKLRLVLVYRSVSAKYVKVPKRPKFLQRMEGDGAALIMDAYWQKVLNKRANATPDEGDTNGGTTEDYSAYL